MKDQLVSYAQNYLSTIMNINVVMATGTAFLLWKAQEKLSRSRFAFLISLMLYVGAIILIFKSYKDFFNLLLEYDPDANVNVEKPFKILNIIFWLDIASLFLALITFFWSDIICFIKKTGK